MKKNNLLSKKDKQAQLGEMFENIIHQFKQPLNAISSETTGIKFQIEMDMMEQDALFESLDNITARAQFLSDTIEDFRDFLKDDKEKSAFSIEKNILRTQSVILPILKAKGIHIHKIFSSPDIECFGYDRELSQVFINIINNAKDAILSSNVEEKVILFDVTSKKEKIIIKIHDSAGGIPENIIDKVLVKNFTTKEESGGTGIGLDMSRVIIEEHFKGQIKVYNSKFTLKENSYYGACFEITLPCNIQ